MKLRLLSNLLLLFLPFIIYSQTRIYKGYLGKFPISLITYSYSDGYVRGIYVYENHDTPIEINGKFGSLSMILNEKNNSDEITAKLEFDKYDPRKTTLLGKWINTKTAKTHSIKLKKLNSFNSYDDNEFERLEILQLESTKSNYFKTIVSKSNNEMSKVIGLNIYEKKTDKLIQSFKLDCEYRYFTSISVFDYNFDNIQDFSIFESSYAGPNTSSIYFLSTIGKKEFTKTNFKGTSLEFDSSKKLVYEHNQCCAGTYFMNATYKIVKNELVLLTKECFEHNGETGDVKKIVCE